MKTPSRQRRLLPAVFMALALSGCGLMNYPGVTSLSGPLPANGPIVPETTLNITKSIQLPLDKVVTWGFYAGAAWLILDPLAPNWEIEQASFPDQHYHMSLKMKRVYTGGAGEARAVFHQRAKELMREHGYDGYAVVEFQEALDSSILGSQRTARGVVRLTRRTG